MHLHSDHTAPQPGEYTTAPGGLPHQPLTGLQFFQREKRAQSRQPASLVLQDASQEVHLGLTSQGLLGKPAEFDHWGSDIDREGRWGL